MLVNDFSSLRFRYSGKKFEGECIFNMHILEVLYEIDRGSNVDDIAVKLAQDSKEIYAIVDYLIDHGILEYINWFDAKTAENSADKTRSPSNANHQPEFALLSNNSGLSARKDLDRIYGDIPDTFSRSQRMGITGKLMISMLLVSMIPVLILWVTSYFRVSSQLYKDTEALMKEKIFALRDEVNQWVEKNRSLIYTFAKAKAIVSMDPLRQISYLKLMRDANSWISYVFVLNSDGVCIAGSDNSQLMDYGDQEYFKENMDGKEFAWQKIITKKEAQPMVVFSTPIRHQKKIIGVLGVAVEIEQITNQMATWRKGQSSSAFLWDDQYKVIAHQIDGDIQPKEVFDDYPLIVKYEKGALGLIRFEDNRGISSVGIVRKADLGWTLAIQQDERDALALLIREKYQASILLLATICLILFVSLIVARTITRPLKKLSIAADRVSIGDVNTTIDTRLPGELGELAASIARMNESIRLALIKLRNQKRKIGKS